MIRFRWEMINLNFKKQGFWPNLLDDKDNMCFPSICFTHSLLKGHLLKQILKNTHQVSLSSKNIRNLYFQILLFCI